jgi:hypothetical protein
MSMANKLNDFIVVPQVCARYLAIALNTVSV